MDPVVSTRPLRGSVVVDTVASGVLRDNPLGDPFTRRVPVYLPPSYATSPDRRYPVLYFLTGFTGRGLAMLNVDPFVPSVPERLDAMFADGRAREAIVVMPDCFTRFGGSQYVDSPAVGRYEDHVAGELVPLIDARYRTLATRDARGVFGKSSGGFGAMWLGMRHADVFGGLACHSGDMYFEYCYKPDFPRCVDILRRAGGVEEWFREFEAAPKKTGDHHHVLNILAMAACYSPDASQPLGVALPFSLETGEVREEVWARWLEFDPVFACTRYADALRSMRSLFIDCGTRDEFRLHHGARVLSARLRALGVAHEHEEFDDTHMSITYRYDVSVPKLCEALAPAQPGLL